MRFLFSLIMISFVCAASDAQKGRYLHEKSFSGCTLSDSWIIVKYKTDAIKDLPARGRVLAAKSPQKGRSILDGMVKIPLASGDDPIEMCNQFLKNPEVMYAEPIVMDRPLQITSDPLASSQYYLENIKAYDAWGINNGDDDISVAIIDTGLDLDHEDLINNLWINEKDPIDGVDNDENGYVDDYWGYDFADEDPDPTADQSVHGVRVGGIVGATSNNTLGMAGIGYNTKIAALKGFRSASGVSKGLFDAILYAAENGIDVLNLSWGSIRDPLQSEQDIINYAVLEKNVVVVAATGNEGGKSTAQDKFYPASYDNVLSVGGSNAADEKWSGSSYNHAVDLIAPAKDILSTVTGNEYSSSSGSGTSFASPMVAATAALVKAQFPTLSAQQIMERVRVTADDIYSVGDNSQYESKLGKGRLNAFRALSENNVKSIRAEVLQANTSIGPSLFYGDTVRFQLQLTNYLSPVQRPSVYVSDENDHFTPQETSFFPQSLYSLEQVPLSFQIVLNEDLEPESNVEVRLDYADGSYSDYQFLDITTSPDYIDFGNSNIKMTIAGDGKLGLVAYGNEIGTGITYQDDVLLKYTGILTATSAEQVADNVISNFSTLSREDDFTVRKFYKRSHHPFADHFGYSEFDDKVQGLIVEQSTISPEGNDFILIRYRIVNDSADPIVNLTFGVFADWDLDSYTENYAEYHLSKDYLFSRNSASSVFAATKVFGEGTVGYSALDLLNENGNTEDLLASFTDESKYDFLVNQFIPTAGTVGAGNDVAGIHGITMEEIAPFSDVFVSVVYTVSGSIEGIEANLMEAENYLIDFIDHPRILETFYTCDGANTIINPSAGDVYEFYEDARGENFILSGSSLNPGMVNKDTSFFVRNIDQTYPSDIFEIRVRLLNEVADFSLSPDTLYLDHPNTNTIKCTDRSVGAVSWMWDFGEGTQSSIQNPLMSFSEVGTYPIALTIENELGCVDTKIRNLIVANRPESPVFEGYKICPGETIQLSHPDASKLFVFSRQNDTKERASGATVPIGPLLHDTTIYVSALIDHFKSTKVPLTIDVNEVNADFTILPDTLSSSHQLLLISNVDDASSVTWSLNGQSLGTGKEVSVAATPGTMAIEMAVQASNGCAVAIQKELEVSTSPTPQLSDVNSCNGQEVTLRPQNGTYFGFYADASLSQLLAKGTQYQVEDAATLYVTGLDDGIPGPAVKVDISRQDFEVEITHSSSIVGGKNRVQLSATSPTAIKSYLWKVDDQLTDQSASPIFFFDDEIVKVVLVATSETGCFSEDTLSLDFTPPLGVASSQTVSVYPNPSNGEMTIQSVVTIDEIIVSDLSGKKITQIRPKKPFLNVSFLEAGLYLLSFKRGDEQEEIKIMIE